MQRTLAFLAALSLSSSAYAQAPEFVREPAKVKAGTYELDASHGKITWSLSHMGFSTYVGQFTGVAATLTLNPAEPAASRLEASVKTESVSSLHPKLDAHLKNADFFDVAKYPTAAFKATRVTMVDADSADIAGDLTLLGVTKPIVIRADFNQAGVHPVDKMYTIGFDGKTVIKRSEFGMKFALPMIGDDVTLHLEAEFKLRQ